MIILTCFLSFVMGYLVTVLIRRWIEKSQVTRNAHENIRKDVPSGSIKHSGGFFDSTAVTVGPNVNEALEAIFEIIIDRYILAWYRTLSQNPDFIIQMRLFLQYLCGALINRIKQINVGDLIVNTAIPRIFNHFEHISALVPPDAAINTTNEDSVLRSLGPHLHVCMTSRSAELTYLRCLVNRLLPFLSLPPVLVPCAKSSPSCADSVSSSPLSRHSRISLPLNHSSRVVTPNGFFRTHQQLGRRPPVPLVANRAAYSFLVEILSAFVLLPAMDALATPDFINRLIINFLTPQNTPGDDDPYLSASDILSNNNVCSDKDVPVLDTCLQEWRHWLSKRPLRGVNLENLLKNKEELCPFIRYMKSVRASTPLTAIILMDEVTRRVGTDRVLLTQDTRREVFAQLEHVIALVRGQVDPSGLEFGRSSSSADDADEKRLMNVDMERSGQGGASAFDMTVKSDHLIGTVVRPPQRLYLLNLPDEFDCELQKCLQRQGAWYSPDLVRLIRSPIWTQALRAALQAMECRFLPMYVESPEYLSHLIGLSERVSGTYRPKQKVLKQSPKRQTSLGLNSITSSLKGMFTDLYVEVSGMNEPADLNSSRTQTGRPLIRPGRPNSLRTPTDNQTLPLQQWRYRTTDLNNTGSESIWSTQSAGFGNSGVPSITTGHASVNVDLSNWKVYIPGLSRPVVPTGRRLIDQLLTLPSLQFTSAPSTHGPNINGYPAGAGAGLIPLTERNGPNTAIPVAGGRSSDAAYRARVTDQLLKMQQHQPSPPSPIDIPFASMPTGQAPRLSRQYLFTVRSETCTNGLRTPVARVDRKYSEFYVLEQRLLEFHGQAITRQLPRRQLAPRTFAFLEDKRALLEDYLQYLIKQPFLRNSELLYNFLTSKLPFSSNIFFDLTFGRLAKAVPIKLTRERGQSLDYFLISFYISCKLQSVAMDPTDESEKQNDQQSAQDSMLAVIPSSGVGILGGTDALAPPEHYAVELSSTLSSQQPKGVKLPSSTAPQRDSGFLPSAASYKSSVKSSSTKRPARSSLDHRLRSRIFWNNASLSVDQRDIAGDVLCTWQCLHPAGLCETTVYFLDRLAGQSRILSEPTSTTVLPTFMLDPLLSMNDKCSDKEMDKNKPAVDGAPRVTSAFSANEPTPTQSLIDVDHSGWCEALFDGPTAPPPVSSVYPSSNDLGWLFEEAEEAEAKPVLRQRINTVDAKFQPETSSLPNRVACDTQTNLCSVSISIADLTSALQSVSTLLKAHLFRRIRHLALWLMFIVWRFCQLPFDRWLLSYFQNHVFSNHLTDQRMGSILQALKATLFYPYVPITDTERVQHREKARHLIEESVSTSWISSLLIDKNVAFPQLSRLFAFLQQAKWNKQLTYVLLDSLVVQLFPELQTMDDVASDTVHLSTTCT